MYNKHVHTYNVHTCLEMDKFYLIYFDAQWIFSVKHTRACQNESCTYDGQFEIHTLYRLFLRYLAKLNFMSSINKKNHAYTDCISRLYICFSIN